MKHHWPDVKDLFGPLAWLLKTRDPDGIELYFTISDGGFTSRKHSKQLCKAVSECSPRGQSNIRQPLSRILQAYQARLSNARSPKATVFSFSKTKAHEPAIRPMSLYVFTDGIWHPECDDVIEVIETLVEKLKQHGYPREQFGIQFVSFGNDQEGLKRLEMLDECVKASGEKLSMYEATLSPSVYDIALIVSGILLILSPGTETS